MPSSRFMQSDITYRYQWFKVNNSYGIWSLIKYEVPQGSILDPILFKIFLCEMFVLVDLVDIASYANDNDKVMLMITPPPPHGMKANQDKCYFLSSLDIKLSLPNCSVEKSICEKLLEVVIDRNLNFN